MCIRDRLKVASVKMKTRYDIHSNSVGFQEGDQVWLFNPKRHRGGSPKLQSNWEGPYTVNKRINNTNEIGINKLNYYTYAIIITTNPTINMSEKGK